MDMDTYMYIYIFLNSCSTYKIVLFSCVADQLYILNNAYCLYFSRKIHTIFQDDRFDAVWMCSMETKKLYLYVSQ